MKKLLASTALLTTLATQAPAAVITDLGLDPTSASGSFNHSLGSSTSAFDDQYIFHLDHTMTLTIASVTNVFPSPTDFITSFTGTVFSDPDGIIGNGDDIPLIGPVPATTPCGAIALCQGFAGSAVLAAGNYYLDISGVAGGTSGYGGNLATFAVVPGPVIGAGMPGAALGLLGLGWVLTRVPKKRAASA